MTVVAHGDQVLLVTPPGESAVLSVEQTRQLSRTLGQAAAANALAHAAALGRGPLGQAGQPTVQAGQSRPPQPGAPQPDAARPDSPQR